MNVALSIGHTANYATVTVGNLTLHFSYETVIGMQWKSGPVIARENDWGPTTGKHLNRIQPDKSKRLPSAEFESVLAGVLDDIREV